VTVEEVQAGDIVAIAGLSESTVPDTICSPEVAAAADAVPGRSADARHDLPHQRRPARRPRGKKVTSRQIRERCSRRPRATSPSA
jgi:GTP-binding protein